MTDRSVYEYETYGPFLPSGERMDTIAQKAYGNPWNYEPIWRSNPDLINEISPPRGQPIRVPLIPVDNFINPESLPPWKR